MRERREGEMVMRGGKRYGKEREERGEKKDEGKKRRW
jgi:hypothetical protein